jgi:hypothetical protein
MRAHTKFFSPETEEERRALFAQARLGNGGPLDSFLTFSNSQPLPLWLPDGFRGMLYPDSHAPAQDVRACEMVFRFADWFRPHANIHVGDFSDMFHLGRWPKAPRTPVNGQGEMEESGKHAREVATRGNPFHTFFNMGNHDEDRMIRFLTNNCPGFAHYIDPKTRNPVLSMVNMMGFQKGDRVTFLSGVDERGGYEGGLLINNHMSVVHGEKVKSTPGESARTTAEAFMQDVVMGHVHRLGSFARDIDGGVLMGYELGCLVDLNHPYFSYAHGNQFNWHLGFGVFFVHGGRVHVQLIPIEEALDDEGRLQYWFAFNGRIFKSNHR